MSVYNSQIERSFGYRTREITISPDTGVSVAVEIAVGSSWVAVDGSPFTTPKTIIGTGLTMRFTPTGGNFFLTDGESL
jgi:hypothetical protein